MYLQRQRSAWSPWLVLLAFGSFPACVTNEQAPPRLEQTLRQLLEDSPGPVHYFYERVELDGEEPPELIVYVVGPMVCGTGGCNTMVFKQEEQGPRLVASISLTRPPIVVAETSTQGWRDLAVHVRGGGLLPGHTALLRYDGRSYPANPTLESARLDQEPPGKVAIPRFDSFTEGNVLRISSRAP